MFDWWAITPIRVFLEFLSILEWQSSQFLPSATETRTQGWALTQLTNTIKVPFAEISAQFIWSEWTILQITTWAQQLLKPYFCSKDSIINLPVQTLYTHLCKDHNMNDVICCHHVICLPRDEIRPRMAAGRGRLTSTRFFCCLYSEWVTEDFLPFPLPRRPKRGRMWQSGVEGAACN